MHSEFYQAQKLINNPSYVSFETACFLHGIIPETVYTITLGADVNSVINTKTQHHRVRIIPVPKEVIDIENIFVDDYAIASKEKAFCDLLYISPKCNNAEELEELIFEDLRINVYIFESFDLKVLDNLMEKYNHPNLNLLKDYLHKKVINNKSK